MNILFTSQTIGPERLMARLARYAGYLAFVVLLGLALNGHAYADRVKDLASVASMRSNQLLGYGLVVGLEGTGDGADVRQFDEGHVGSPGGEYRWLHG